MTDIRKDYGLPPRYFLSLGRMVEKKNLATLVSAYARYAQGVAGDGRSKMEDGQAPVALVFVGSGELEEALREQAGSLGLRVVDRTRWGASGKADKLKRENAEIVDGEDSATSDTRSSRPVARNEKYCGAVFFYGFRQIEENAVFYALAEAFVLPSLYEEWGLVVNEAMAAGLPVIVSRTAGCVEDLVPASGQLTGGDPASRSMDQGAWSVEGEENAEMLKGENTENSLDLRSNGFAFDPTSVDALATALAHVAELEDRRWEMGKRSREIVEKFSCGNFARQALLAAEAVRKSATD